MIFFLLTFFFVNFYLNPERSKLSILTCIVLRIDFLNWFCMTENLLKLYFLAKEMYFKGQHFYRQENIYLPFNIFIIITISVLLD